MVPAGPSRQLYPFRHAGSILLVSSLAAYLIFKRAGWYKDGAFGRILSSTGKRVISSSVGITSIVMMAVIMSHAGMTDTLEANEDAIRANLRYLLLRFHGRRVAVDAAELEPWTQLLSDVAVGSQGEGEDAMPEYRPAWESVCVTLINHPDFFTY